MRPLSFFLVGRTSNAQVKTGDGWMDEWMDWWMEWVLTEHDLLL